MELTLPAVALSKIEQEVKLSREFFKRLDVDADTLMKRADLDGNGELEYAEYERDENGEVRRRVGRQPVRALRHQLWPATVGLNPGRRRGLDPC